jgi:hypothetical protein
MMSLVMVGVDPTSSPTRPPPWSPGPTSSWPASESRPAPPAPNSCWTGPDSSRSGAGRRERPPTGLPSHPVAAGSWGNRPGRAHDRHRAGPRAVARAWPQDRRAAARPPQPGSRPCRATPPSCSQRTPRSCWRCGGAAQQPGRPAHPQRQPAPCGCCASSSRVALHASCAPTGPPRCCVRSTPDRRGTVPASRSPGTWSLRSAGWIAGWP